jgi:MmyB-like transcription regulator ligand binding domain
VFRGWHELPCIHRNLLWCGVTEPSARDKFLNYDDEVPYLVARLRANYAAHVGDPEWEEDIRRLCELSAEFAGLWARHEVCEPEQRLRIFLDADVGELRFTINELAVSAVPGTCLIVYSPNDTQTRDRLEQLARLTVTERDPSPGISSGIS